MQTHPNAKLGPAGRLALTEAIASGMTQPRRLPRGARIGQLALGSLEQASLEPPPARAIDSEADL